tara:strand:+ start:6969 stop:7142 length:174 start_codon:yes stop_codon:yes gene_type:complete
MDEHTGWHFSITIPMKDKAEAIKELSKIKYIEELINTCVPSYEYIVMKPDEKLLEEE